MKEHEAVIKAMRKNGGYATLQSLYQSALKVPWSGVENEDSRSEHKTHSSR